MADAKIRSPREIRQDAGVSMLTTASFSRPPAELLGELQQEALDLAGWGFVLWCRLDALKDRTALTDVPLAPEGWMVGAERGL